ncbi:VIT1/CCC1 transporter family protein [Xanthobacter agilis]|uniref:VIT1/CCC1 family predicted Fe2+/Mn2+ transporter n=2 Tax=Xanthobacter agilis TaxID=47492 RepID=A0ABU0LC79_XANAG|nr:VIT family protein [Xanthobacter agilis]MDQ0504740.1 VIT1/CCC1 family predicted Fe2+/Mn2+ transporter [Xanthobacter agilis]
MNPPLHTERHVVDRIGWLRAAVLGANDGIISTSSLMVGVASAATSSQDVLVAGIAGIVAGALSMAAGEYVSVSSQADTEAAELAQEKRELAAMPAHETRELAAIYVGRGVEPELAIKVAEQLMEKDALGAHARDELGISDVVVARPIEAALTSACTFSAGAIVPIIVAALAPASVQAISISAVSLVLLAVLGALGAKVGGAPMLKPTLRVAFWGALAMAVTAGVGHLVGAAI